MTRAPVTKDLFAAFWRAADRAVDAGATPYDVDRALVAWGFARGPFALRDRIGLDRAPVPAEGTVAEALWLSLLEAGRTGAASGAGFYRHFGGAPAEDPALEQFLASARSVTGKLVRPVGADEISLTVLAALAATGARSLAAGATDRPGDVDLAAVHALGFPRWRGGPMLASDQAGVLVMRNTLRELARDGDPLWQPAPLWDDLVRNGRRFSDLDRASA